MIDQSRRGFFSSFLENSVQMLAKTCAAVKQIEHDTNYFDSYESAYTLISENLPFIDDEVERLHIDKEGKTQLEIVKEIYEKSHA
jgi:hypothetical protein